jgi:hypothetical protein
VKTWLPIFLIVAGLTFVIGSNLAQHMAFAEAAPTSHESPRSTAPRKKAQPAKEQQGPMTFGEYPCPGDCAEDKAGYDWAARNSITDPDNCTGMTGAFIEGCRVYAEQRSRQPR